MKKRNMFLSFLICFCLFFTSCTTEVNAKEDSILSVIHASNDKCVYTYIIHDREYNQDYIAVMGPSGGISITPRLHQ